ncbi:MAG: hypothetical protein ACKOJB_09975, partial [Chthoniobacterales bacterium]
MKREKSQKGVLAWQRKKPALPSPAMSENEENILCVPRAVLDGLGAFEGLSFEVERYMPALLDPA